MTKRKKNPAVGKQKGPDQHDAEGVRLQKVLANAGVASRRVAEQMIADARVEVNGQIVTELGTRIDPETADIRVDDERVVLNEDLMYLSFNKPRGVISTMSDPQGRRCIGDFIKPGMPRLYHVGRLDSETEGLILLTNDGELAHRLAHPSYEVPKTYLVQVKGPVAVDIGKKLTKGIHLDDGFSKLDSFKLVDSFEGKVIIEVVLHSGKNRIVRRLFDAVGYPVQRLVRVQIGPVKLGTLKPGTTRPLPKKERAELFKICKM